jgi:hypothetical protein
LADTGGDKVARRRQIDRGRAGDRRQARAARRGERERARGEQRGGRRTRPEHVGLGASESVYGGECDVECRRRV